MYKILFFIVALSIINISSLVAQVATPLEPVDLRKNGSIGFGISTGFFYPHDVNNYLESYWNNKLEGRSVEFEAGFTELFMYYSLHGNVAYRYADFSDVQGIFELGWGPKIYTINSDMKFFNYFRFSPGVATNFYLPVSESGNLLFAGVGILNHFLIFEEYDASTIGFKATGGYRLKFEKYCLDIFLAYDYIKANTGEPEKDFQNPDKKIENDMELDYSGFRIGISINMPSFNF